MKVVNVSGNTLYAEDIDTHFPFYDDRQIQEVGSELLKRSACLRSFILCRFFDVVEYDPKQRIEAAIMYKLANNPQVAQRAVPDASEATTSQIEVKLHGLFYDASGYAKVNRNLALGLSRAGVKLQVDARRSLNQLNENELRPITALENTSLSKKHIRIDSVVPTFAESYSGVYRVLYTTVESYSVPKQFVECCNTYDEIWVTSDFSAEILRQYTNRPVYVVVTGVDPELYNEDGAAYELQPNCRNFVFLSLFAWGYRKGYDTLLKAYFSEFSAEDDVTLLIASRYQSGQHRHHKEKIAKDIEDIMIKYSSKDLPHLVRYGQFLAESEMPLLYRACNCFVLCTRGEGGCLPPLEASMCGLPVIMTNCSGQQGYLRKDNAYLIDIDSIVELQPGQSHVHFWDGQKFPALTSEKVIRQAGKHMRDVYEHHSKAQRRNKKLQKLILKEFTWASTTAQALLRLRDIRDHLED